MIHDLYYLVEPRSELCAHLTSRTDPDLAEVLTESVLLRDRHVDRSPWTYADHVAKMKLLYLARIRDLDPLKSNDAATRLLSSELISIDLFDRWWTIRLLDLEGEADELQVSLRSHLDVVDPTDRPVVARRLTSLIYRDS